MSDEYINKKDVINLGVMMQTHLWTREQTYNAIFCLPSADVAPVRHGHWKFSVHEERMRKFVVDAECSECGSMKFEVWCGFFPDTPRNIVAEAIALENAEKMAMPNYCEDCGAKMNGGDTDA